MDLVLWISPKCGQGRRESKNPKILWTSCVHRPLGSITLLTVRRDDNYSSGRTVTENEGVLGLLLAETKQRCFLCHPTGLSEING